MKKTAVVTGAGRGIGLAVARQLGMDGCRIVMTARGRAEDYREAVSALISCGIETAYVQADISIPEDRRRIVEETVRLCGRIDILVNNAGVAPLERADLLDMTEESFDRVIGINTKGTMFLTQLVAKQMLSQEWKGGIRGYIVNISSCSAEVVSTNRGEYCVSKAGISMLTRLYADRLAIYSDLVMTNGYEKNRYSDGLLRCERPGHGEREGACLQMVSGSGGEFAVQGVLSVRARRTRFLRRISGGVQPGSASFRERAG